MEEGGGVEAVTPTSVRNSVIPPSHPQTSPINLSSPPRRSGYNCVIYGWDPKCTMSQEWITTMRVNQLPSGPNQPFYNVLVQDGTCRYAAQGTTNPLTPNPSPNSCLCTTRIP